MKKDYVHRLDPAGTNLFVLRSGRDAWFYQLTGWLELTLASRDILLRTANLSGELASAAPAAAPSRIHLAVRADDPGRGRIDRRSGRGSLAANFRVDYPELVSDRRQRRRAASDVVGPVVAPLELPLSFGIQYGGGFKADGLGTLPRLRPLTGGSVAAGLTLCSRCLCDEKKTNCLEVCLDIKAMKVPKQNQEPYGRLPEGGVESIIEKVNAIWGCRGGQCCIRFRIDRVRRTDALPRSVRINQADGTPLPLERSDTCWNLYFVQEISGSHGLTVPGGNFAGSIVSVSDFSADDIASTTAHELGHALGIDDHSSEPKNLMHEDRSRGRDKLNRGQCDQARLSPLCKDTGETCDPAPRER